MNATSADLKQNKRKSRVGVVVSNKMDKSIVVVVERRVIHPIYKKYIKSRTRFMAHDEENTARVGDHVLIEETRPLSKMKCWRLKEVIRRAPVL